MGAKTKEVGGGSAKPVANEWNNFLMEQLQGSGQGQGQFGSALNNALSGNVRDISGAGSALQNMISNPNQFNLPTNFGNQFSAAQFSNPNLSALGTNFGAGQTGMANLSNYGNAAQSNANSQFTGQLSNLMGQGANMLSGSGGFNAASAGSDVGLQGGMSYQDAYNTLGQDPLMERNRMKAVADMRARFGAEGAGALGTGAQFAEGNLNAELAAQDASRRRAESMQLMGQDLNERSTAANVGLQNRGQNVQTSIANMQGGLQGAQNMNSLLNSLMGNAIGARGQDFNQAMFNAGQQNDLQSAMINATLQNQSLGNQFGVNAAQINNAAMQANNANQLNLEQLRNTFNQNNAQLGAQYGLAANQLNSQNQNLNNMFNQNAINQGLNMNQMGNQNTMNSLAQLFGSFGQSNALGTPAAQIMQTPSGWSQAINAATTLGGAFLGGPLGSQMGSMLGRGFGGGSANLPIGIGGGALPQSMSNFQFTGMPVLRNYGFGG